MEQNENRNLEGLDLNKLQEVITQLNSSTSDKTTMINTNKSKGVQPTNSDLYDLMLDILRELQSLNSKLSPGQIQPFMPSVPVQPIVPIEPIVPNEPIPAFDLNQVVCKDCGLKLENVMGYVCNRPKCPTGLGGTFM